MAECLYQFYRSAHTDFKPFSCRTTDNECPASNVKTPPHGTGEVLGEDYRRMSILCEVAVPLARLSMRM